MGVQFREKWGTQPLAGRRSKDGVDGHRNSESKAGEKPFKIYDREGLFLLVNPSGSKLWRWRYRFDGKEKLMALGEYPLVGLGQARELHLAARKSFVAGIDPMAERKAEGAAKQKEVEARQREAENSFEYVAREWWKWWLIGKSPRHADTTMRRLEADVFPGCGHQSVNEVTAADVQMCHLYGKPGSFLTSSDVR